MPPLPKPHMEQAALARAGGDSEKRAYQAAGLKYDAGSAHRFFRRPQMVARVAEIMADRAQMDVKARQVAAEESGVTLGWLEQRFKYISMAATRGDPVRKPDGSMKRDPETGAVIYKPDYVAAVRALESLTRMKGGFIDRTEIGGPGDFSRMNDIELEAQIVQTAKELGLPAPALKMLEDLTKKEDAE